MHLIEPLKNRSLEQHFGLRLFGAMNIDFRLDYWHETSVNDLRSQLELLVYDLLNSQFIGVLDHRAHLGPEYALRFGFLEQRGKRGHWLHELDPVLLSRKALVHFQEWHHLFYVPKIVSRRLTLDFPVHGVLEQDGADNPLSGEAWAGNHAGAHLVHDRKHLIFVRPGAFF